MSEPARILRIVIASPSDVAAERAIVSTVLEDVNNSAARDRGLLLEPVLWETDAYPGFHAAGPQGLIEPILRIENCDLLVGIFWKRFGTPLEDARSGTEHEIRRAVAAWQEKRRPQVMVYFNQKSYTPQSKDETDQWGKVLEFRKEFPKQGLWWPYKGTTTFERLLRRHLTNFIRDKFPTGATGSVRSQPPPPAIEAASAADYFGAQRQIIEYHTRTFVGRRSAQRAFEQFVKANARGYFLIRGAPGQGKTALACQIVKTGRCPHHFVSRTGGRDDARLILRSLLSQLAAANRSPALESIGELTKAFEDALSAAASSGTKVVVVVDALDELPDAVADPPFLPIDGLPNGVFIVVTARPGSHLDRLEQRLFAVARQTWQLGPLEISEMRDIVKGRQSGFAIEETDRIAEASQGNPLYLCAAADELARNPNIGLQQLPETIEGFFRDATSSLRMGNPALGEVTALLSVVRKPLSLRELSQISGRPQREIVDDAIRPIQQFLLQTADGFTFYHTRFHEFVTRSLLYGDELRAGHRHIADWLERPECRGDSYRFNSLAWHLYESGARERLLEIIGDEFLAAKLRRFGYGVLEDVELVTRSLLETGDADVLERCVRMVQSLREIAGGDIIPAVVQAVLPWRSGPASFRTRLIEPPVPSVPGLDVWAGVLPKAAVAADFLELALLDHRLAVAIGDAPAIGLKSTFVARFVANLFRQTMVSNFDIAMDEALTKIDNAIRGSEYFKRISMQCMIIDPRTGVVRIGNGGHPSPVHYSARRGKCDILPLRGDMLHARTAPEANGPEFLEYRLKLRAGDILVLITDGLIEAQVLAGDSYGYGFTSTIENRAAEGARAIGEAILDNWRAKPREADVGDDVSVIVISASEIGRASE